MSNLHSEEEKHGFEISTRRQSYKPLYILDDGKAFIKCSIWHNSYNSENSFYFRSFYLERFWLGILGPSSTWLLRMILMELEQSDNFKLMSAEELCLRMGLSANTSWNSPFSRSLRRLLDFKLAKQFGLGHIAICQYVPPLSCRQIKSLTAESLNIHRQFIYQFKHKEADAGTNFDSDNYLRFTESSSIATMVARP